MYCMWKGNPQRTLTQSYISPEVYRAFNGNLKKYIILIISTIKYSYMPFVIVTD